MSVQCMQWFLSSTCLSVIYGWRWFDCEKAVKNFIPNIRRQGPDLIRWSYRQCWKEIIMGYADWSWSVNDSRKYRQFCSQFRQNSPASTITLPQGSNYKYSRAYVGNLRQPLAISSFLGRSPFSVCLMPSFAVDCRYLLLWIILLSL